MALKMFKINIQKRYLIAILAFFGYMNMFTMRTNLSMAMVDMTSNKTIYLEDGTLTQKCEFNWTPKEIGIILSAFSYGYIFTFFGGIITTKFGGATVFGCGIALTAMMTMLTPFIVYFDLRLFILCRVAEGLFEAVALSSMSELWYRWSPAEERSRLVSFSFTGVYVGLTVSYPVSGFVANIWGWPAIFYFTGAGALIWSTLWLIVVRNDPSEDKSLSEGERLFLANRLSCVQREKIVYPWKSILTSIPVWTLWIVEFVFSCGYTIIILYLPLYIKDISQININSIGLASALPHLCAVISHPLAGYLADVARNRNIITATQVHKLYICAGFFIGAILLNIVAFGSSFTGIMIALSLFRFFTSFSDVAFHVNVIDLAPQYSSLLLGMAASFFTFGSLISPLFISQIVKTHSQSEWNLCFTSFSILYIFGAVLFLFFGSGDNQPWSKTEENELHSTS